MIVAGRIGLPGIPRPCACANPQKQDPERRPEMASESTSNKAAADYEAIVAQLNALRDDLAKLGDSVGKAANDTGKTLARDIEDGVAGAARYVSHKGHEADLRVETAIASNPYLALGLAAGVGLLLGALTRRG